jgi:hypothetical protein
VAQHLTNFHYVEAQKNLPETERVLEKNYEINSFMRKQTKKSTPASSSRSFYTLDGKEAAVNRVLDGNMYPG